MSNETAPAAATVATGPPWAAHLVFGNANDAHRECCQCCAGYCAGYCPAADLGWHDEDAKPELPTQLTRVTLEGREYITDNRTAVLTELVSSADDAFDATKAGIARVKFATPDEEPGPTPYPVGVVSACLLADLGIDIREGDGPRAPQPLYLAGEHVGFTMPAVVDEDVPGAELYAMRLADLAGVRAVAKDLPVVENRHPLTTAAALIGWERHRAAGRSAVDAGAVA